MDHPRNRLAPLRNESKLRKETFENGWPADKNFLSIDTFVNQGFYYLGVGNADRVQCVYCAGVLSQWEAGDDIETEHRRNFPQCPLMKRPMKNPSYRDLSTRKLSFQGWPPQKTQTPDDLAEAGLFYLGKVISSSFDLKDHVSYHYCYHSCLLIFIVSTSPLRQLD